MIGPNNPINIGNTPPHLHSQLQSFGGTTNYGGDIGLHHNILWANSIDKDSRHLIQTGDTLKKDFLKLLVNYQVIDGVTDGGGQIVVLA